MILIKCLVKSISHQKTKTKKQTDKQSQQRPMRNCTKIVELYEKKTAPLIGKIRMKCNPIPIVHCAIFGQVHDEELSNCHTIENQIEVSDLAEKSICCRKNQHFSDKFTEKR